MSETKTNVKIPVGWLRLDRGVTTLPGDWFWSDFEKRWRIVCSFFTVPGNNIVIRRCRYAVGETVYVWKCPTYVVESCYGTAIIDRVFASDHRGVQRVALKKTGNSATDSWMSKCSSDILAPAFQIATILGPVPQVWNERDIAQFGNDPNEATQTETVVEALKQAELTEEPQPEPWVPNIGDWVVRPGGKPGRVANLLTMITGEVCYLIEGTNTKFSPGTLKPWTPTNLDWVRVTKPASDNGTYGWLSPKMDKFDGATLRVCWVSDAGDYVYAYGAGSYAFCVDWLEPAEAPTPNDHKTNFVIIEPSGNPGQLESESVAKQSSTPEKWIPKIGDLVRIKKPSSTSQSSVVWSRSMDGYDEQIVQIKNIDGKFVVHDSFAFEFDWLEPADRPVVKQSLTTAEEPQSDHIADANKMVGNLSEAPNGSAVPKPRTLYIAGPMRGIAYFNYPMFDRIAGLLRDQGLHVISPADEDRKQDGFDPFDNPEYASPDRCVFPSELDFKKTVRRCLDAVMQCEEIVLLPGWERSSGAVAELTLAMWLNKRVRHVLIDKDNQVSFVCFWKGLESLAVDLYDEYLPESDEPGDLVGIDDDEEADDILEEALNITRGSRNASYGPPDQDFRRTAGMWSALFAAKLREGETFEPRDVALAMILLKTSRETHQRKRDNWVDIAGYARCGSLCN